MGVEVSLGLCCVWVGRGGERTVIWAYRPHITFPPAVTIPSSLVGLKVRWGLSSTMGWDGMAMDMDMEDRERAYLTLHSITVPLLKTPS